LSDLQGFLGFSLARRVDSWFAREL
jgi:hypothetical protein